MKKIIALLLTMAALLSLAACGGSTTTTTTTPDVLVSEPETPSDPAEPGTSAEEDPAEWDGNYETATFDDIRKYGFGSTNWDGSLPLTTTGEKLTIGLPLDTRVTNYDTNPTTRWLEERTGVDIVIKTFSGSKSDISTQYSLMFTGGEEMPDVLYVYDEGNARRSEYLEAGYYQNIAGYFITDAY